MKTIKAKDKRDRYEVTVPGRFKFVTRFPADDFEDAKENGMKILEAIGRKKGIEFYFNQDEVLVGQIVKKHIPYRVRKEVSYDENLLEKVINEALVRERFRFYNNNAGGFHTDQEIKDHEYLMNALKKLAKNFDFEVEDD